jgi:hypothetical protein
MVDSHVPYQQKINYQIPEEVPLLCSEGRSITGTVEVDSLKKELINLLWPSVCVAKKYTCEI